MIEEWVQDILRQCRTAEVIFFFKQWGGVFKSRTGRELNNRTYDELPTPPQQRKHKGPERVISVVARQVA